MLGIAGGLGVMAAMLALYAGGFLFASSIHGPLHRPFLIRPKRGGGELHFYSRRLGRWVFSRATLNPGQRARRRWRPARR